MKWAEFGSMGGSINYTSGGGTPEVPRDHNLVSGSMNVGDSGQYYINVKTNPDDQSYPQDLEDEFNPSASGYSPVNGQPSAGAGETIEETGTPTPPPPPNPCPCGNVEASVAPSTGAAIVSLATGDKDIRDRGQRHPGPGTKTSGDKDIHPFGDKDIHPLAGAVGRSGCHGNDSRALPASAARCERTVLKASPSRHCTILE